MLEMWIYDDVQMDDDRRIDDRWMSDGESTPDGVPPRPALPSQPITLPSSPLMSVITIQEKGGNDF